MTCAATTRSRVSDSRAREIHTGGRTRRLNGGAGNVTGERGEGVREDGSIVATAGEMA